MIGPVRLTADRFLKLHNKSADVFIPDAEDASGALQRITHLGIGAHQDDLEFMAFHGIAACHGSDRDWFGGVVCTNGAGSARTGEFEGFTDGEMTSLRREEQRKAAVLGRYAAMVQLDYPSSAAKDPADRRMIEDLQGVLSAAHPGIVYTHNLADKHDTHVAVALKVLLAIRALPPDRRPRAVHGCEVWRDLDWMEDREKIVQDVTGHDSLSSELGGVFRSQIAGGKRYDLAVSGRRRANATFLESHQVDQADAVSFAMDLTPLVIDDSLDIAAYVEGYIERFRADVRGRIARHLPK
jgi:LmbE family N-acetylglucosaminyl deacetylase